MKYEVGEVAHIYRQSIDGIILFYSHLDFLVMFIIVSRAARKYDIVVIGFCPMVDHLHLLIRAKSMKDISCFMRDITSQYAVSLNETAGESCPVFKNEFGLANKLNAKKVRSAINYLYNNPVEKKLCRKPSQWRWNFLAYMGNPHPFSPKFTFRSAPSKMRKAVAYVRHEAEHGNRISYRRLSKLFENLDEVHANQLIDCIITAYNFIDYGELIKYYKSYDAMLLAMESNTGGEYDIDEEHSRYSDVPYFRMTEYLSSQGVVGTDRILTMPPSSVSYYSKQFVRLHLALPFQIRKYFHLSKKNK